MTCSIHLREQQERGLIAVRFGASDDRGLFRISDIPAGRYYLHVHPNQPFVAQPHPLTPREEMQRLSVPSYVPMYYPNGATIQEAAPIDIESGSSIEGIEMQLKVPPTVSITGRVAFAGEPPQLPGIHGMLFRRNADGSTGWMGGIPLGTRGKQEFVISNVTPGSYVLQVISGTQEKTFVARQLVEVGQEPLKDLVLTMKSSIDVPLTITMDSTEKTNSANANQPDSQPIFIISLREERFLSNPEIQQQPDGTFL